MHISRIDLFHVRFTFQVRSDEIRIAIIVALVTIILLLITIEIVSRDARDVLQVVQRRDLWHLGGER